MAAASLPPEGELRLGPVALPAGKHIRAGFEDAMPVAWVTHGAVPDAGRIWAALWDAHPHTGLVPFLLGALPGDSTRPWDQEEFGPPAGVGPLEIMNPAAVLEEMWEGMMPSDEEEAEPGAPWAAMRAPFSRRFPGLAPATDVPLTPGELDAVLAALPPQRIGLAPAARGADVLPGIGWFASDQFDNALPVAVIVRSWEERFGARLLRIGFSEISLLATRPPRSRQHAQHLAAEHYAICDECAGKGLRDIPAITDHLLTSPIWTFWWD